VAIISEIVKIAETAQNIPSKWLLPYAASNAINGFSDARRLWLFSSHLRFSFQN
jgi:hypothetical protein